jgi:predicted metal-binding protein
MRVFGPSKPPSSLFSFTTLQNYQPSSSLVNEVTNNTNDTGMTKSILALVVSATVLLGGETFSPAHTHVRIATQTYSTASAATSSSTAAEEEIVVKTKVPVAQISVCAGELCQCQGEEFEYTGGASDAAINELEQLNLPFPIEEVGCLGACGMGTMIAIDFENGDSVMTDGLDSTYSELGISVKKQSFASASANVDSTSAVTETTDTATKTKKELVDVRDRMRQEAVEVEVENPWLKMGGYLAKKATEKLFSVDNEEKKNQW